MSEPTASERLRAISHDLRRLSPCSRNPHLYHELKSDLVHRVEKLADEMQGIVPPVRAIAAPKGKVHAGSVTLAGRVIQVEIRPRDYSR
jgi:hypothetical protein